MAVRLLTIGLWLALIGCAPASAGFRSPESVVRNVYAYYGDRSSELSSGLPRDPDTAKRFFDPSLQQAWASSQPPYDFMVQATNWKLGAITIAVIRRQFDKTYVTAHFTNNDRKVAMNFIVVRSADGWVIDDVESPHDSLRLFLKQYAHQTLRQR